MLLTVVDFLLYSGNSEKVNSCHVNSLAYNPGSRQFSLFNSCLGSGIGKIRK